MLLTKCMKYLVNVSHWPRSQNDIFSQCIRIFTNMIDFVIWPPLQINNDGTKRWPSDKVNHICENAYALQEKYLFSIRI